MTVYMTGGLTQMHRYVNEDRARRWITSEPDPDVLEQLLGLNPDGLTMERAFEVDDWLMDRKEGHWQPDYSGLYRVVAEEWTVLTPAIVSFLLRWDCAEQLAKNKALTGDLLIEGLIHGPIKHHCHSPPIPKSALVVVLEAMIARNQSCSVSRFVKEANRLDRPTVILLLEALSEVRCQNACHVARQGRRKEAGGDAQMSLLTA